MKLKEITWKSGNVFEAMLKCEHCGNEQPMFHGYSDENFYLNVIPAIKCTACDKRTTEDTLCKINDPGYRGAKL